MRIALLTDGIYPYVMGGMQKHSYYLAKYFAQNRVTVDLYHFIPQDRLSLTSPFSKEELRYIQLIEIGYPKSKKFPGHYLFEQFHYSKAITYELVKRDIPDFIYAKGFSGWYLLKHREKLNIQKPIGVNFHGYEMFQRWPDVKTGIKLQILKLPVLYNMRKADYLFSYGGKISEIIKTKGFEKKIVTIPTGISQDWILEKVPTEKTECVKFCFVGRAERRKGIEELNTVLSPLKSVVNFKFHFVGPIPENRRINDPRNVYHGPIYDQNEIKTILQASDILVCPSYSEGMPNVILEGMASGCAIIATDVGAVSEMVDEKNGWLIKGAIDTSLRDALNEAIYLPFKQLSQMKKESVNKVTEHFTWEKVIEIKIRKIKLIIYA